MSLGEILDEIREGTEETDENIETEETKLASEEIRSIKTSTPKGTFKISKFDNKVVDKFNNFYNRCRLQQITKDLIKVDRGIAQEAMATLPEINKVDESKFTSYPSAINKKLLDEIVFTGNTEIPVELEEVIREMLREVNTSYDLSEEVHTEIIISLQKLKELLTTKFGPVRPIVIHEGTAIDLIATPLHNLAWIDDSKLYYDKYSGVLTKKVNKILFSDSLSQLKEFLKENCGSDVIENPSIQDLCNEFVRSEVILQSSLGNISNFKQSATKYFEQTNKELTGWVSDLVNSLDSVVKSSDNFNRITSIMEGEEGLISLLIDFLEFID